MNYEITAAGFDGGTDETDHLVIWVNDRDGVIPSLNLEKKFGADVTEITDTIPSISIDYWIHHERDMGKMVMFLQKAQEEANQR